MYVALFLSAFYNNSKAPMSQVLYLEISLIQIALHVIMHYWVSEVVVQTLDSRSNKCGTCELIEAGYIRLFQVLNFLHGKSGNTVCYRIYTSLYYCHM